MRNDEIKGTGRLIGFVVGGGTDRVYETHKGISQRVFKHVPAGRPVQVVHDGTSAAIYKLVSLGGKYLPRAAGSVIAVTKADTGESVNESRGGRLVTSALNGIWGDFLAREVPELAHDMQLDIDGEPSGKLVVFFHGLCESNDAWANGSMKHYGREGVTFGSRLRDELGYTPIYVRFNSGMHVSHNGREFSRMIEQAVADWPVPVEEIALVGHSMGGLIARSACHYGAADGMYWTRQVRHVITLATPHLGAPLERGVHRSKLALDKLPETKALAKWLDLRSAGVRDLRFGYTLEEEWDGIDSDDYLDDRSVETPFLPTATYYFVAATITKSPDHPVGKVLGDLMVQLPSASGHGPRRRLPFEIENGRKIGGMHHFNLLNHPHVYEHIVGWLTDRRELVSVS